MKSFFLGGVWVWGCAWGCVCACVYICVHMHLHVCAFVCACMCAYVCVCVCVCVCACVCMHACTWTCARAWVRACVCVYQCVFKRGWQNTLCCGKKKELNHTLQYTEHCTQPNTNVDKDKDLDHKGSPFITSLTALYSDVTTPTQ